MSSMFVYDFTVTELTQIHFAPRQKNNFSTLQAEKGWDTFKK